VNLVPRFPEEGNLINIYGIYSKPEISIGSEDYKITRYPSRDSNGYPATGTGFEEMWLREEYKWIARKSS
jgi:hypothetical protein